MAVNSIVRIKRIIFLGCLLCALSVALGAFGSHYLSERLDPKYKSTFDTGVLYQFLHALGLIITALVLRNFNIRFIFYAAITMLAGVVLFSGSLYLIIAFSSNGTSIGSIGLIPPIGGTLLIVSWILFMYGIAIIPNHIKDGSKGL